MDCKEPYDATLVPDSPIKAPPNKAHSKATKIMLGIQIHTYSKIG